MKTGGAILTIYTSYDEFLGKVYPLVVAMIAPASKFLAALIFTALRNARIASAVLAIAIPSVCPFVRLSVTRRYCVKTTARSMVQFAPLDSKICLVL